MHPDDARVHPDDARVHPDDARVHPDDAAMAETLPGARIARAARSSQCRVPGRKTDVTEATRFILRLLGDLLYIDGDIRALDDQITQRIARSREANASSSSTARSSQLAASMWRSRLSPP